MEEEKKEKEQKQTKVKITLSKPNLESYYSTYYSDWNSRYISHLSPECQKFLDDLNQIGIESWKVVEYALEPYLDKDLEEVAKAILAWEVDLVLEFKKMKEEAQKGAKAKK